MTPMMRINANQSRIGEYPLHRRYSRSIRWGVTAFEVDFCELDSTESAPLKNQIFQR